jgi:hypothetical protein
LDVVVEFSDKNEIKLIGNFFSDNNLTPPEKILKWIEFQRKIVDKHFDFYKNLLINIDLQTVKNKCVNNDRLALEKFLIKVTLE